MKEDFSFVLQSLSYLSGKGRAAIVCFPGNFYRGGAEQKIRKYLMDNSVIAANDYNLSVSSYVEPKDNREKVDIATLNAEISETVTKINSLRTDIEKIVAEIEL